MSEYSIDEFTPVTDEYSLNEFTPVQTNTQPNIFQQGLQPQPTLSNSPLDEIVPEKSGMRQVADFAVPFVGELGGAWAGAKAGAALTPPIHPLAKPAGALVGMALGAGAGHLAGDVGVRSFADGKITEEGWKEALADAGESAAWTAAVPLAIGGAVKGYQAAKGLYIKGIGVIDPKLIQAEGLQNMEAKAAEQALLRKHGASYLTAHVIDKGLPQVSASLATVGYGGKGIMKNNLERITTAVDKEIQGLVNIGRRGQMSNADFGQNFARILDETDNIMKAEYGKFTKNLADNGIEVPYKPVQATAQSLLDSYKTKATDLDERVVSFLNKIVQKTEVGKVSPVDISAKMSELAALSRQLSKDGVAPYNYDELGKIREVLENSLEASVKATGNSGLIDEMQAVNAMYKEGKTLLNQKAVSRLWDDPSKVATVLYSNDSQLRVDDVMKALQYRKKIDPKFNVGNAMNNMRSDYVEHMLKAGDERTVDDIYNFANRLKNPRVKKTYDQIMGGSGEAYKKRLETVFNISKTLKEKTPEGAMSLIVSGRQASAVSSTDTNPVNYAWAFVPYIAAKMANNPDKVNRFVGLSQKVLQAPERGFVRNVALANLAQFVEDERASLLGTESPITNEQSNPVLNQGKMQSTM